MVKSQSEQTHGEASAELARPLSSEVIVFNESGPLWIRLFWLLLAGFLFISPALAWFWFTGDPLGTVLLGALFGLWAFVLVASIVASDELTIDLSERHYRICKGLWPFIRTRRGTLSEIRHLCLQSHIDHRPGRRGVNPDSSVVQVVMVWKNDQPDKLLESKSAIVWETTCIERNKNELKTYADRLAARLQVPVIEDVEA